MLCGIDEGVPYRVDPVPLNVRGELKARLQKRQTFSLHGTRVCHRNHSRMQLDDKYGRPPVFATHVCDSNTTTEDIDLSHLQKANAALERASFRSEQEEEDPEHERAVWSIVDILAGRVEYDQKSIAAAPF